MAVRLPVVPLPVSVPVVPVVRVMRIGTAR
jgi:hypothetical protein